MLKPSSILNAWITIFFSFNFDTDKVTVVAINSQAQNRQTSTFDYGDWTIDSTLEFNFCFDPASNTMLFGCEIANFKVAYEYYEQYHTSYGNSRELFFKILK